ncbi:MAG: ABC transporter substrate-binding protein [Promethearchaeota archaeon]
MNRKSKPAAIALYISIIGAFIIGGFVISTNLNQNNPPTDGKIFVDSLNRHVIVPYHPNRIISLSPSITETLYLLGIEDRVVGVSSYCNYPEEVANKTDVGGFTTPDLEIMAGLDPDLIISAYSAWNEEEIANLEQFGCPLVIILANTIEEIIDKIGVLADLTNVTARGIEVMDQLSTDLERITNKTETLTPELYKKCYFEVYCVIDDGTPDGSGDFLMGAGPGSFLHDMMEIAGATNILDDTTTQGIEYVYTNHEKIVGENPEVIFLILMARVGYDYVADFTARVNEKGYENVNATKNSLEHVYMLDDDLFSRLGPRVVNALENMTRYLHPELLDF